MQQDWKDYMVVNDFIWNSLTGNSQITDLVGTNIFIAIGSQDCELPLIVYNLTDIRPTGVQRDTGSRFFDFEVDCYAKTFDEAWTIAQLVEDEFVNKRLENCVSNFTGGRVEYRPEDQVFLITKMFTVLVNRV